MVNEPAVLDPELQAPQQQPISAPQETLRPFAFRRSEWLLIAFFSYVVILGQVRGIGFPHWSQFALLVPAGLALLVHADRRSKGPVWSIVRDWVPAALVLLAYWTADWYPQAATQHTLEGRWIAWDRTILNNWGLRTGIEVAGRLLPAALELAYLLLYTVPPLAILYFYLIRQRRRLDDFLFPFLLGTLITYSLLPHFPTGSPRFLFAGEDLPGVETIFRRFNLWILTKCDIHSSVFPSGHVTVAFSAAFAMLLAMPTRRRVGLLLLTIAFLVLVDTVYGRYHYAVDGLAGVAISLVAAGIALTYNAQIARRRA